MTFDIQSVAPEGYEVVGFGTISNGDVYIRHSGKADVWRCPKRSECKYLILKKKWTPKVGEVVAVRDSESQDWTYSIFTGMYVTRYHTTESYWKYCRQLTPKERGES